MLSIGEMISAVLTKEIGVGNASIDTDQGMRDRAMFQLDRANDWLYSSAPFEARLGGLDAAVTITATAASKGLASLPSDYSHMGKSGNIYLTPGQFAAQPNLPPLQEKDPQIIEAWLRATTYPASYPTYYCHINPTKAGVKRIQVFPSPSSDINLDVVGYLRNPPDLVDRPAAPTVTVNGAGSLTGTYQWGTTYVNSNGETEYGPLSAPLVLTANQVTVQPASSQKRSVTSRNVYRSKAAQVPSGSPAGPVFLSGSISDNLPWSTYADNVVDGSLTTIGPVPAQAITGIEWWHQEWQRNALLPGLIAYMRATSGDDRYKDSVEEWQGYIKRAWAEMKPMQQTVIVMPAYAGSRQAATGEMRRFRVLPG